jgi:hypothetical protein
MVSLEMYVLHDGFALGNVPLFYTTPLRSTLRRPHAEIPPRRTEKKYDIRVLSLQMLRIMLRILLQLDRAQRSTLL